jgi:hypothetical protein
VEGDPVNVVKENKAAGCEHFAKDKVVDAVLLMAQKVDPGLLQELDGVVWVNVINSLCLCVLVYRRHADT